MNENPRFGKVQILVFAKRFSPFCFFESHFISRKQKRKNRTILRLFDIKKRPKLGCLIFEFQISTSIHSGAGEGNRTLVSSLEGWCSTIELHPRAKIV